MSKGIFIPDITVEMIRKASLEAIETLLVEGEMYDVDMPKYGEISVEENGAVIMNLETLHSLCQDDSPLRKQMRDKHQVEYVIAKGIRERSRKE